MFVSLLGIFIILSGCKADKFDVTLPNKDIVLKDMPYGDDPYQTMDVYLPANRTAKTKIIVYVHGGTWYAGDKNDGARAAIYFQERGYAFISINYRLTRTAENYIHPAQIQDIGKALDFISQMSVRWIITGNRICLYGSSAGAHLSLLYAYKYNENRKVKAVVSVSGLVDLTDPNIKNSIIKGGIISFIGSPLEGNEQAWLEASPSNYISGTCVPTLFFHGTKDAMVPYRQSVSAYNTLLKYGVNTKIILFPDTGHDLQGVDREEIFLKIEDFINSTYL